MLAPRRRVLLDQVVVADGRSGKRHGPARDGVEEGEEEGAGGKTVTECNLMNAVSGCITWSSRGRYAASIVSPDWMDVWFLLSRKCCVTGCCVSWYGVAGPRSPGLSCFGAGLHTSQGPSRKMAALSVCHYLPPESLPVFAHSATSLLAVFAATVITCR